VESEKNMKKLAAVILAAGMGTRMKSEKLKVLHELCGKSLIRRACDLVRKLGVEKTVAVIPPQNEKIKKELPEGVLAAVQEKALGTGHAVLAARSSLQDWKGDILILCADAPLMTEATLKKLIEKHREGHYYGTVLSGLLSNPAGYGRLIRGGSGEVLKIVEDSQATSYEKSIEEINSGTYCFDWPALSEALDEIQMNPDKNELFLTDAVGIFARQKKTLGAFCAENAGEVLGINSRKQLAEAEKILRDRIRDHWMENGVTLLDPASIFIDEEVEIGTDTVIHPFTMIEGRTVIGKRCVIGPFAHIREKTILHDEVEIGNFVEVKASEIGPKVKAKHLTYLGNARIGSSVNIGAGTITANYDGKTKSVTQIEDGAFIGSGTILVAPVKIGRKAVTGAGAVVTKNKDVPEGEVVIGVPAKRLKKKE
jgi:bifunctional UDP-N-acetylglucosamine pyrophosphorylase/glucosamine-1-phosphate N-acetyltransferase